MFKIHSAISKRNILKSASIYGPVAPSACNANTHAWHACVALVTLLSRTVPVKHNGWHRLPRGLRVLKRCPAEVLKLRFPPTLTIGKLSVSHKRKSLTSMRHQYFITVYKPKLALKFATHKYRYSNTYHPSPTARSSFHSSVHPACVLFVWYVRQTVGAFGTTGNPLPA